MALSIPQKCESTEIGVNRIGTETCCDNKVGGRNCVGKKNYEKSCRKKAYQEKGAVTKRPDDFKENSICEENAEEEGRGKDFQNDRLDEDEIEASKNNYIGSDDHGTDLRVDFEDDFTDLRAFTTFADAVRRTSHESGSLESVLVDNESLKDDPESESDSNDSWVNTDRFQEAGFVTCPASKSKLLVEHFDSATGVTKKIKFGKPEVEFKPRVERTEDDITSGKNGDKSPREEESNCEKDEDIWQAGVTRSEKLNEKVSCEDPSGTVPLASESVAEAERQSVPLIGEVSSVATVSDSKKGVKMKQATRVLSGDDNGKSRSCEGDPVVPVPDEPPDQSRSEPEHKSKTSDGEENSHKSSSYARVFYPAELDALEEGTSSGVNEETEEYEKELEERLFPLDEVELNKRMKRNAEKQNKLTLKELSKILEIPEDALARTRESSPGVSSTPEYWIDWYRRTLASSAEAKRANRDFRPIDKENRVIQEKKQSSTASDGNDPDDGKVARLGSYQNRLSGKQVNSTLVDETTVADNIVVSLEEDEFVAGVGLPRNDFYSGDLLRSWLPWVRKTVYSVVKEEELGETLCLSCRARNTPHGEIEKVQENSEEPADVRIKSRIEEKLSVFPFEMDALLRERLVDEVVSLYDREAPLIKLKLLERRSCCESCRSVKNNSSKGRSSKRVSFNCSSLYSGRSEALGSHYSRSNESDGLFQYVYVVTDSTRRKTKTGLVEIPQPAEAISSKTLVVPEGKRVIGSVGGIEAVSTGYIDCVPMDMLIDSGAVASLVDYSVLKKVGLSELTLKPYSMNLNGVSGKPLDIRGVVELPIRLGTVELVLPFVVAKRLHVDVILGTDALKAFRAVIDLEADTVMLKSTGEVFPIGSPRVEEMHTSRINSTIRIRPGGQVLVVAEVQGETDEASTVLVEGWPELDSTVQVARTLCTVRSKRVVVEVCNSSTEEVVIKKGTLIATVTVVPKSAFTFEDLEKKAVYDDLRGVYSTAKTGRVASSVDESMPTIGKELHQGLDVDFSDSTLGDEQKRLFKEVLESFTDLFVETSVKPGRTDLLEFSIDTGDHPPIKQRPYRVSKAEGDVMEAEIQQYLDKNFIRPSTSPWASPVLMIRKPDGGIRFCIDYRRLNAVTIKDCYPMPLIDDILDVLGNAKLFSTMDIASGYWNVPMAADSVEKTAFTCKYGLYEWLVMPFGLCNAVPAFERLMENVLVDLKWRTCLVYLDDCVVFSEDFPTHLVRLKQVLERFRTAGFKLKMKKCKWGRDQVAFLGHIVTPSGILPNPEKVKAVMNVERPHDIHTVRAFLGLTSYFRRYIPGYAAISAPIERLKMKGVPFKWSGDCETAFMQLKRKLVEPPILVYPDFNKRFKLYVDSSKLAVGACLMQTVNGRERAIAYASKLLVGSEKNWIHKHNGTSEIECWGVVWATRKFRCYLDRREFDLYTDHKALTWVFNETNRTSNAKLARWAMELAQLRFKVFHKAGTAMGHVDGLSRLRSATVCALSMSDLLNEANEGEVQDLVGEGQATNDTESSDQIAVSPVDVFGLDQSRFVAEQRQTPWIMAMIAFLESGALALDAQLRAKVLLMAPHYVVKNGVLMRRVHLKSRAAHAQSLEVPVIPLPFIATVLHHCHSDAWSAHVGVTKTRDKVRRHAYWHGWKRDVDEYVRECATCGSGKGYRPWKNGLMQKMPIHELSGPFSLLVVDAVGPLVTTPRNNKFILVFADYFTRWVEAFPVERLDTVTFVETMVNEVISRHGVPERLLSDQGSNFISELARSFYETLGIKKLFGAAHHPQTQGLVERFNGTLIGMLKMFVNEAQDDWDLYLPRVLFAYRTSYHEALKDSPFFSLYGRDPVLPLDLAFLNTNAEWKSNEVAAYRRRLYLSLRDTRRLVERQLLKAQGKHEQRLEGQVEAKFMEGDPVWVYQYFRARRGEKETKKLAFSWHGPYRVVRAVGENAYKIAIPSHPNRVVTINVNRLKSFRGRWSRPFPSEVPTGVLTEAGVDDDGPLTEEDLPSTSYVERLVIGGEETAFSNVGCPVVDIIARRKKNGEEQFLVLLATYETSWRPRASLLPQYSVLIKAFEDTQRKERGLLELRRSSRLADANVAVDEDEILF